MVGMGAMGVGVNIRYVGRWGEHYQWGMSLVNLFSILLLGESLFLRTLFPRECFSKILTNLT